MSKIRPYSNFGPEYATLKDESAFDDWASLDEGNLAGEMITTCRPNAEPISSRVHPLSTQKQR